MVGDCWLSPGIITRQAKFPPCSRHRQPFPEFGLEGECSCMYKLKEIWEKAGEKKPGAIYHYLDKMAVTHTPPATIRVINARFFSGLLTISSPSSCLLCRWRRPGPLCAGQHTVCCSVTCLSSLRAVPQAFTSCQPCRCAVRTNIPVVTFLMDAFGNWLTFHFRFKPCKNVTLCTR